MSKYKNDKLAIDPTVYLRFLSEAVRLGTQEVRTLAHARSVADDAMRRGDKMPDGSPIVVPCDPQAAERLIRAACEALKVFNDHEAKDEDKPEEDIISKERRLALEATTL
jgi:hypothetical protein